MRTSLRALLAVGLALAAVLALAEPDTFYLGKGGQPRVFSPGSTVINRYALVTEDVSAGANALQVNSTSGFSSGQLVMVLQMTGTTPAVSSGSDASVDLPAGPIGQWEFARVSPVSVSTLNLSKPLIHTYQAGRTQVVLVPEYDTLYVPDGSSITAGAWDGGTGGVVAFLVQGTLFNDGLIDATGKGFRGGPGGQGPFTGNGKDCTELDGPDGGKKGEGIAGYDGGGGRGNLANGGGGGICLQGGGGGGANAGPGGIGGKAQPGTSDKSPRDVGGMGGAPLSYSLLDRLTMGGGGGGGHGDGSGPGSSGGNGGGLIYIRAGSLLGNGTIAAAGASALESDQAAGGGGAGGSISLRVAGFAQCAALNASGGNGGNNTSSAESRAPGGGGGGGQIFFQYGSGNGCSVLVDAGLAGVQSNSGTDLKAQPTSANVGLYVGRAIVLYGPDAGFSQPGPATVEQPAHNSFFSYKVHPSLIISGSAPPGKEVVIYLDGGVLGRSAVSDGGTYSFDAPTLFEGQYQVQAATAFMGLQSDLSVYNTFTVDNTEPNMGIDAGPPPRTRSQTARFTFASDADDVVGFECNLDGGAYWPCGAESTFYPIAEGAHTLTVRAVDRAGNRTKAPASWPWEVDVTAPPAPAVFTPAANALLDAGQLRAGNVVIRGSANDAGTVVLYINSASAASTSVNPDGGWEYQVAAAGLPQGTNVLQAVALDDVGNVSDPSPLRAFTLDTVTPAVPALTAPVDGGYVNTNTPLLSGNAEARSIVIVDLDDGGQTPRTIASGSGVWSVVPTTLNEGRHSVQLHAEDDALNASAVAHYSFIVDTQAPVAPDISFPVSNQYLDAGSFSVQGGAEPGGTVLLFVDDRDAGQVVAMAGSDGGVWNYGLVGVPDGVHWVRARAVDPALNSSFFSNTVVFTVDTGMNPATSVDSPRAGLFLKASPVVISGHAEPGSTVDVSVLSYGGPKVSGGTVVAGSDQQWQYNAEALMSLGDGRYSVTAEAVDRAGNKSGYTPGTPHDFILDRTAPETVIDSAPPHFYNKLDAGFSLSFSGTEPGSVVFDCTLDGGSFTLADGGFSVCSNPIILTGLQEQTYTLMVRARDQAGNLDPSPAVYTWTVDVTPPVTSLVDKPPAVTEQTRAIFRFDAGEPSVNYECMLDDAGTYSSCTNPYVIDSLVAGNHTLRVQARDRADNVDVSAAEWSWVVDTGLPVPEITAGPANSEGQHITNALSGEFSFRLTVSKDAGTTSFQCRLDDSSDGGFQDCVSPYSVSVAGTGTHLFQVRAIDGLRSTPEYLYGSYEWVVDQTPPETEIIKGPKDWENSDTAQFRFAAPGESRALTFRCGLDDAGFKDCKGTLSGAFSEYVISDLKDGAHTLQVVSQDVAGNLDDSPATYSWNVDTVAPAVPTLETQGGDVLVRTNTPAISGQAEPDASVFILLDDGTDPIVQGTTLTDGRWRAQLLQEVTEGAHVIRAYAVDRAGNRSAISDPISFIVDTQAPETEISGCPTSRLNNPSLTLAFASPDPEASFECSLEGEDFKACDSETTISDLQQGAYILRVRAKDRAGNVDLEPASCNWRVYLGTDSRAVGGGLGCAMAGVDSPGLVPFGLLLLLVASRRRTDKKDQV